MDDVLNIAEVPFKSGKIQYRYSRYLTNDGAQWIRHGLFTAYHENGQLLSEGLYEHGLETGTWRDFYANGQIAAEGVYVAGKEHGLWRSWATDGESQATIQFEHGREVVG